MQIKRDFPFYESGICFFDTAASAQKPDVLLQSLQDTYARGYANIHRGIYSLSDIATTKFEDTRAKVARFIGAQSKEVVFVRNATEGINLIAYSYAYKNLKPGDEVAISYMEHHSNILPWQKVCKKTGAILKIYTVEEMIYSLSARTKIVACTHMSNVLGYVFPIKTIVKKAHSIGAVVVVDACQSIVHYDVNVMSLECDFLVFSGHKLYGPGGVGVIYGRYDILESMDEYQVGGGIVEKVSFEHASYVAPPHKFESGTPPIAEVIAFGAVLDSLYSCGREMLLEHEQLVFKAIKDGIHKMPNFSIVESSKHFAGCDAVDSIVSILHNRAHSDDIALILDQQKVAVRSGHHCAQPLLRDLGLDATLRISLGIYNDLDDVGKLLAALSLVDKLFR